MRGVRPCPKGSDRWGLFFRYGMGDAMKALGALQQLVLGRCRCREGVLGLGQVGCNLGRAHPQSIPEALTWLQRNPGAGRQGALGGGGEKTERDGAGAGTSEQLTNRDSPFGVYARNLGRPRDQRAERAAAKDQSGEHGDQEPEQCGAPWSQDPRLRRRSLRFTPW